MLKLRLLIAVILLLCACTAGAAGAESFRPYATGLIDRLVAGVEKLDAAIDAGNLAAAKSAWINARYGWERGETFYAIVYPKLDTQIDSWPDAKHGFHALEAALFKHENLEAAAKLTDALLADVRKLQRAWPETELTSQQLLNGLAGLAFEIGAAKATGGESPFSGTSLQDMQNNMIGIETTYYLAFAPILSDKAPKLHAKIIDNMIALTGALRVDDISAMDTARVMRLSEKLALLFVQAAEPLGLEPPQLAGA